MAVFPFCTFSQSGSVKLTAPLTQLSPKGEKLGQQPERPGEASLPQHRDQFCPCLHVLSGQTSFGTRLTVSSPNVHRNLFWIPSSVCRDFCHIPELRPGRSLGRWWVCLMSGKQGIRFKWGLGMTNAKNYRNEESQRVLSALQLNLLCGLGYIT